MKNVMKLLIVMILISACTPHNYPDVKKNYIRFYPGNDSTYQYITNHNDSVRGYDKMIPNGYVHADGISYTFTIDSNFVEVEINTTPLGVRYMPRAINEDGEQLGAVRNFSKHLHEYGFFIVDYVKTEDY